MRRACMMTVAGWLFGAASIWAQSQSPPPMPLPPGDVKAPERMPSLTPYTQYARQAGPTQGEPPMEAPRPTPFRPNGVRTVSQVDTGIPQQNPVPAQPPLVTSQPNFMDCGGRSPNPYCAPPNNSFGQAMACCPCGVCGPPGRLWFGGEYMLWWGSGMSLPPLVTGAPVGTPLNILNPDGSLTPVAGALGQPGTVVLFGGNQVLNGVRSGYRARAGFWLDECNMLGLEASFLYGGSLAVSYNSGCTDANGIVMRPFFNASTGRQDAEIVSFPSTLFGFVTVDARSEVYGADANIRRNLICSCNGRLDFVAGYRFMSLTDRLQITECLVDVNPNNGIQDGTTFLVKDRFETDNFFHGGQIGLAGELRSGRVFLEYRGLVGLGASVKQVRISGSTTVTTPNGPAVTNAGGLLAQNTNIGTYNISDFAVLPEGGLNLGLQLTDFARLWVGYTFMYWNNVARAGSQIDFQVNSTQIPPGVLVGPPRPAFNIVRSDYWLQGVSFGAQLRF